MTLDRVVVDLRTEVFAHGQLYTALSRVCDRDDALILMPEDKVMTANIVYRRLIE
jgi:ATP-dependent exoDNAse (exonuclease V) alpha subunit